MTKHHPLSSYSRPAARRHAARTQLTSPLCCLYALDGMEKKTSTFTGTSAESRSRPVYGFQEMAHTLLLAEDRLRDGVEKGIYGRAVEKLFKTRKRKASPRQIDGATDVVKSVLTIEAAVSETVEWLQELDQRPASRRFSRSCSPKTKFSTTSLKAFLRTRQTRHLTNRLAGPRISPKGSFFARRKA